MFGRYGRRGRGLARLATRPVGPKTFAIPPEEREDFSFGDFGGYRS